MHILHLFKASLMFTVIINKSINYYNKNIKKKTKY